MLSISENRITGTGWSSLLGGDESFDFPDAELQPDASGIVSMKALEMNIMSRHQSLAHPRMSKSFTGGLPQPYTTPDRQCSDEHVQDFLKCDTLDSFLVRSSNCPLHRWSQPVLFFSQNIS